MEGRLIEKQTHGLQKPDGLTFRPSAMNPKARACNAKGDTCILPAMANGKCYKHSGRAKSGADLPQYKGAGYSKLDKALPGYLQELKDSYMEDWAAVTDLTDVASERRAVMADMWARFPSGESGETWKALREHCKAYRRAESIVNGSASGRRLEEAVQERDDALSSMLYLIEEGAQEAQLHEAIGKEAERLTRIVGVENKRRESAANVHAIHMVKRLLYAMQTDVQNPEDRARLQRSVNAILGAQ